MVEEISRRHGDYPGILAKCRDDYDLGDMWIRLGFSQVAERLGRSSAGHILVCWWRDHHHPNLFTRDEDGVLVRAAIDLNVLWDLTDPQRTDAAESQALQADQVSDRLELVRTAALDAEINRKAGVRRAGWIVRAERLPSARSDAARVKEVRTDLLDAARRIDSGYPRSDRDEFDLDHVVHAIAANLNVLVTRDEDLKRVLGPAARERFGLRILRPADVVIHLDELARAEAYRPAALLGTNYRRQMIGVDRNDDLTILANPSAGERPRDFLKHCRNLAVSGCERVGIYDPGDRLVAAIATAGTKTVLTVPLLRVASTAVADTMARQLLFQLREQARTVGAAIIAITDRYLPQAVRLAALNDGFRQHDDRYYGFAVDVCAPAAEVEHQATIAARRADLTEPAPLRSDMPAVAAAELERTWWPAKITDSKLTNYVIPIRQAFSADLLGVPQSLLPRHDSLGLAREHVYYRSTGGPRMEAPARLLWYISSAGPGAVYPSGIVACSQLDMVAAGSPEEMFSRFQHLGVWNELQVRERAQDGMVQALRFTNTEPLHHIPLSRLRTLAAEHGQKGFLPQGPLRVSAELFDAIYREGRSR